MRALAGFGWLELSRRVVSEVGPQYGTDLNDVAHEGLLQLPSH
jgi:hypothetical protein